MRHCCAAKYRAKPMLLKSPADSTAVHRALTTFLESQMINRRRGTLIGLAIGDALGAAVEFHAPGTFARVTGYRNGGPHGLNAGEWTDDTSMALALADSIAVAGWDL